MRFVLEKSTPLPLERFVESCSHRVQHRALLLSSTKNNMYLDNTDHLDSCKEGEKEWGGLREKTEVQK